MMKFVIAIKIITKRNIRINPNVPFIKRCTDTLCYRYSDKFSMVERATQTALVQQLNMLCDGFGLTPAYLKELQALSASKGTANGEGGDIRRTVTLRFEVAQLCTYLRTDKHDFVRRENELLTKISHCIIYSHFFGIYYR